MPDNVVEPPEGDSSKRSEQSAFPHRRVGLVEDHESVAIGMSVMLKNEPDLELVCIATTVSELLTQNTPLDLAILDLRLADGSSPKSNVEQLRASGLETLIFTGAENPYLVRSAARAGVLGVVRKSEPAAVVIDAIRTAASGIQVVTTEWAAAIDGDPGLGEVGLSPRQLDVLELYASGEKADRVARLTGSTQRIAAESAASAALEARIRSQRRAGHTRRSSVIRAI